MVQVAVVLLLVFASQLACSEGSARYVLVLAEGGSTLSGNCRGNGGSADRVNSKSKLLSKQTLCRDECDLLGKKCSGYSYTAASENCVIHGPGMSGTCALEGRISENECGICGGKHSGLAAKQTRSTCGDCSLKPTTHTIWEETENFCRAEDGEWTAGTWAPSKWSEPADGWIGHSHATTYVHSADGVEGTDCYDKNPWDGRPQCLSASEQDRDDAEHLCQNDFDDDIWEQRNAGADDVCPRGCTLQKPFESYGPAFEHFVTCRQERSPAEEGYDRECTKNFERNLDQKASLCKSNSCQFKKAPVMRQIHEDAHAPAHRLPGWRYDIVSRGDTVGQTYPEGTFGDCRIEGNGMKTVMSKSCGRTCTASNGMSVVLQEGCAQACLDDASGSCVGYAHSADFCILYSPFAHRYLVDHNGDTWAKAGGQIIPCISHNSPGGCKTINAAKPNPAYICALLEQTPSRWEAWGQSGDRKYVAVRIITSGATKDKFTTDVAKSLRLRMAGLAFVNASSRDDSQVALSISTRDVLSTYSGSEIVLDFVVAANASTDRAVRKLLDAQTSTAAMANNHFKAMLPSDALVVAVHPAGAGRWPNSGLTAGGIAGIVCGILGASALSVCLAWRHLKARAKTEAQQMHFEIQNAELGHVVDDDRLDAKSVRLDDMFQERALQEQTDDVEEYEIADPTKENGSTSAAVKPFAAMQLSPLQPSAAVKPAAAKRF